MLKVLVRKFADSGPMPLETAVMEREVYGKGRCLENEKLAKEDAVSRDMAFSVWTRRQ